MSPILVRPVREQLEHDRVVRLLQAKYKRKFDVAINPGDEQTAPVAVGSSPWYPDLVLQSADRRPKLLGTVEIETAESVNSLEAMSQWATFSRFRAPFHLYIPVSSVDTAKRLCVALHIPVAEIWTYNLLGDQILFTLVHRSAVGKTRATGASRATPRARQPAAARRTRSGRKAVAKKAGKKTAKRVGRKHVVRAAGTAKPARAARAARAARVPRSIKAAKFAKAAKSVKAAKFVKAARVTKKTSRAQKRK